MKTIDEIRKIVQKYAHENDIKSVRLFGSYADGKANQSSDVDLLVEYNKTPSLMNFLGLQEVLQDELNTKVDLIEYPIDKKRLFYKDFKINKEILIYG